MKVKLFWKNMPGRPTKGPLGLGGPTFGRAQQLNDEVNVWLGQNPGIRIVDIKQSASGGSFAESLWLISVWYEEAAAVNL